VENEGCAAMTAGRASGDVAPAHRTGRARRPALPLALHVLGELELWRGGERLELPQSKKTRAQLA
jgi:hypothetical protein